MELVRLLVCRTTIHAVAVPIITCLEGVLVCMIVCVCVVCVCVCHLFEIIIAIELSPATNETCNLKKLAMFCCIDESINLD